MRIHMFLNATAKGMSGGDKRALEMLSYFLRQSVECTVYAPQSFTEIISDEGIKPSRSIVTSSDSSQNKRLVIRYIIHTLRAIKRVVTRSSGVIFYSSSAYLPDLLPAIYGKFRNQDSQIVAPVFHLIEHYSTRPGGRINNFIAYYEQRFSLFLVKHFADRIIVINTLVQDHLREHNYPMERVHLVDCGVDAELINNSPPFSVPEKQYDAVFMGRLVPSKGVFDLAEIWSSVVKWMPGVRLAIIGSGSSSITAKLEKDFEVHGISRNVDFLGFIKNSEAYSYMKSASAFVFPSHEEGWGIVIADAMACGLPVVTYDLPVFKSVFKGINCEASFGDTNMMANLIVDVLSDNDRHARLRRRGEELVFGRYTWDVVATREMEILKGMGIPE